MSNFHKRKFAERAHSAQISCRTNRFLMIFWGKTIKEDERKRPSKIWFFVYPYVCYYDEKSSSGEFFSKWVWNACANDGRLRIIPQKPFLLMTESVEFKTETSAEFKPNVIKQCANKACRWF